MKTLYELRCAKFLTQEELAKLAKVAPVTVSRIETGAHKPTFKTIRKIAKALKVDPSEIKI